MQKSCAPSILNRCNEIKKRGPMKYIITVAMIVLFTSAIHADTAQILNKAPPISKSYTLIEVAPDVYVIHGPKEVPSPSNQGFMNNPSFIVTDAGVVVIDPGSSVQTGDMLLKKINTITKKPVVAIFITHVHGDHWLGNDAIVTAYPKVKIYAHPLVKPMLDKGDGQYWIDFMLRLTKGATAGTQIVVPTDDINDGDTIMIGGLDFQIIHPAKAHTVTDIMILVKQKDVLFLGDNANNGFVVPIEGSLPDNIKSLDVALASTASVFIPGHGKTAGKKMVHHYQKLLMLIYNAVKQGYANGLEDYEIRTKIEPKLAQWKNWTGFKNQLGKIINFSYLELENKDF